MCLLLIEIILIKVLNYAFICFKYNAEKFLTFSYFFRFEKIYV